MSEAALVSLRDAGVQYGPGLPRVLDGVTLDLVAGERLAVIGESGSGKSTLALALAGLLPRDAVTRGDIAWPALGGRPSPGRDIGIVYQDPSGSLDPVMRIGA